MYAARDLFSPSCIKKILGTHSLSLSRKLGQNFLINRQIAGRILEYANLKKEDRVLEVGSGLGTLTFFIAERTEAVVAVELDGGFSRYLHQVCKTLGVKNVYVLNEDFLRLDPRSVCRYTEPSTAVSNFPYSIALKAILKILEEYPSVRRIVGTVQQEIAERITAKPGEKNYSSVSVCLQFLSRMSILESHIAPGNFYPAPEVESSVISIDRRGETQSVELSIFREIVRASFANRRKSLVNNLLTSKMGVKRVEIEPIIRERFGDVKVRAERLSVWEFTVLAKEIQRLLEKKR